MAAVLSGMDGIFTLKEGQRTAPKTSLGGRNAFALVLTGFGESRVKP